MSGVDPGVDPTHTPGEQSPPAAAEPARVLPPLSAQADMAKPSTMIAQMPIAAGIVVMMVGFSSFAATASRLTAGATVGFVAVAFTTW